MSFDIDELKKARDQAKAAYDHAKSVVKMLDISASGKTDQVTLLEDVELHGFGKQAAEARRRSAEDGEHMKKVLEDLEAARIAFEAADKAWHDELSKAPRPDPPDWT